MSWKGIIREFMPPIVMKALRPKRLSDKYPDFEKAHLQIINLVRPYTSTTPERIHALVEAVKYVTRRRIPGTIVECGVWRGGSMMAAARTLQILGATDRDLYLFDTFEGMSAPTNIDVDLRGQRLLLDQDSLYVSLEDVKRAVATVGYPEERIHYVQGKVEDTVPTQAPPEIALLRLDTDWYESTKHELNHLYPRLSSGGVLIVDDYGHWKGSRQATDEFIAATPDFGLLTRIDYTGRLAIKPQLGLMTAGAGSSWYRSSPTCSARRPSSKPCATER